MDNRIIPPTKPTDCNETKLGSGPHKRAKIWTRDRAKKRPGFKSSFPVYFDRLYTTHPLRRGSLQKKLQGDRWKRVWSGPIYKQLFTPLTSTFPWKKQCTPESQRYKCGTASNPFTCAGTARRGTSIFHNKQKNTNMACACVIEVPRGLKPPTRGDIIEITNRDDGIPYRGVRAPTLCKNGGSRLGVCAKIAHVFGSLYRIKIVWEGVVINVNHSALIDIGADRAYVHPQRLKALPPLY